MKLFKMDDSVPEDLLDVSDAIHELVEMYSDIISYRVENNEELPPEMVELGVTPEMLQLIEISIDGTPYSVKFLKPFIVISDSNTKLPYVIEIDNEDDAMYLYNFNSKDGEIIGLGKSVRYMMEFLFSDGGVLGMTGYMVADDPLDEVLNVTIDSLDEVTDFTPEVLEEIMEWFGFNKDKKVYN